MNPKATEDTTKASAAMCPILLGDLCSPDQIHRLLGHVCTRVLGSGVDAEAMVGMGGRERSAAAVGSRMVVWVAGKVWRALGSAGVVAIC